MFSLRASIFLFGLVFLAVTIEHVSGSSKCLLPMSPGVCNSKKQYYYFNQEEGHCVKGEFTSCPGNKNYFRLKSACDRTCAQYAGHAAKTSGHERDEVCHLPVVKGDCVGRYPVYSFDSSRNGCIRHYYTGCDGNANRFKNFATCNGVCKRKNLPVPEHPYHPQSKPHCSLPMTAGSCTKHFASFYFDPATLTCKSFVYTGCYGNSNRFPTLERCQQTCWPSIAKKVVPTEAPVTIPVDNTHAASKRCNLPLDLGQCNSSIVKYYFDTKTSLCRSFHYKGCGGNFNRFESISDCMNSCKPVTKRKWSWGRR